MAMTWKALIRLILVDLRVVAANGSVRAEDEDLALDRINLWIDGLKTEELACYESRRTLWNLTTAASYAIGSGAAINIARPVNPAAVSGFAYMNNNLTPALEVGLGIPLTRDQYQGIPYKSFQAAYPASFFYEPTFPNGTVYPYPIPTTSSLQGVIYSDVPVDEVTDRTANISLAPGYRRMILLCLKVELADAFRLQLSDQTIARWMRAADDAKGRVKAANEELVDMSMGDAAALFGGGGGASNIYTGE